MFLTQYYLGICEVFASFCFVQIMYCRHFPVSFCACSFCVWETFLFSALMPSCHSTIITHLLFLSPAWIRSAWCRQLVWVGYCPWEARVLSFRRPAWLLNAIWARVLGRPGSERTSRWQRQATWKCRTDIHQLLHSEAILPLWPYNHLKPYSRFSARVFLHWRLFMWKRRFLGFRFLRWLEQAEQVLILHSSVLPCPWFSFCGSLSAQLTFSRGGVLI